MGNWIKGWTTILRKDKWGEKKGRGGEGCKYITYFLRRKRREKDRDVEIFWHVCDFDTHLHVFRIIRVAEAVGVTGKTR